MKNKLTLLVLFLGLAACNSNDDLSAKYAEGKKSRNTWNQLKLLYGNSYTYRTITKSFFAGRGTTTELEVENGVVIRRKYESFQLIGGDKGEVLDSYEEFGSDVGSHENGMKPQLLDELYGTCVGEYLKVDKEDNEIYFETNDQDIVTECGYRPYNCADDCFFGFTIEYFSWQ